MTFTDQNKILNKYLGVIVKAKKIPTHKEADGVFLVPEWEKVGKTYSEALQKVLDALKKDRQFFNYRKGQIDESHIKRPDGTLSEIIHAQMGKKYRRVSVREVKGKIKLGEYLLGAYEVGVILLTHPDILKSYDDLWIDCPRDEFSPGADGAFSGAPSFEWSDGELRFDTRDVYDAYGHCGSASGFSPQSLETGALDHVRGLTLRVEALEEQMEKLKNSFLK